MVKANGIEEDGMICVGEPSITIPESFYDQANRYFRRISRTVMPINRFHLTLLEWSRQSPNNRIIPGKCYWDCRSERVLPSWFIWGTFHRSLSLELWGISRLGRYPTLHIWLSWKPSLLPNTAWLHLWRSSLSKCLLCNRWTRNYPSRDMFWYLGRRILRSESLRMATLGQYFSP